MMKKVVPVSFLRSIQDSSIKKILSMKFRFLDEFPVKFAVKESSFQKFSKESAGFAEFLVKFLVKESSLKYFEYKISILIGFQ